MAITGDRSFSWVLVILITKHPHYIYLHILQYPSWLSLRCCTMKILGEENFDGFARDLPKLNFSFE